MIEPFKTDITKEGSYPMSDINGQLISGALPYDTFGQTIDGLLSKQ